jgi:hypothetical protein
MEKKMEKNKQSHNLEKLILNRRFLKAVSDIRVEHNIPQNGFSNFEKIKSWKRNLSAKNSLSKDITILLQNFALPDSYNMTLTNFVFFNEFPLAPAPLIFNLEINKETKQLRCMIEIFGDTTIKDFEKYSNEIKRIQRGENTFKMPLPLYKKRYKFIKNLLRDEEVRRLREDEGLKLSDIAHRTGVDYQEVPKLIKRLKHNIGENNVGT